ncbi:DNA helicase [Pullulanibacillus camelliae]|uniref:DNA 3'-5' helicase n=1 Tax=Pullulanibacillus camelliae TaxID=1707096 RepID=A0A8J2VN48_9BACL|nr:UvrD-helicase domain-containing protein [Pullulanibacillus camelliae]GGE33921.1 DNA helicase [Pullulanibacillus camelliae]
MEDEQYASVPFGSVKKEVPVADCASRQTSKDLIEDSEFDAFYFRSLEKREILLNAEQLEAVRHTDGPFLTLAGAGTGKTSVLVSRTGYLYNVLNVPPSHILLVTFTRKAAEEMKERIAGLPGLHSQEAQQVQANTFHAFFLTILRHQGYREGILSSERYRQIIVKQILKQEGLQDTYQPETLLALFSHYKVHRMGPDDMPHKTEEEKKQQRLFRLYETWKEEHRQLDFDDILLKAYDLLKTTPALLRSLQQRFRYVMVDEFQDTNFIQYELIKLLVESHHNLFVVGDDDQTIYSFNGASNQYILNFTKDFPKVKSVALVINYRSNAEIIGLGNSVIAKNLERKAKTLKALHASGQSPQYVHPDTLDHEAECIIETIKQKKQAGKMYRDMAILHRTANNSRAIFEALVLHDIPFIPHSLGVENFYEQWIVKPMIDILRLTKDSRDFEAIKGMLPTLYISRESGMDWIQQQESIQRKQYPLIHLTRMSGLKGFQSKAIEERLQHIKQWQSMTPLAAIKSMRMLFYDKYLETTSEQMSLHKEMIKETLDELEASAKRFSDIPDFLAFIEEIVARHKQMKQYKSLQDAEAVNLMTIHRAKGLEFPIVFLIGATEGILPHSTAIDAEQLEDKRTDRHEEGKTTAAIEEECRLAYVAITRAKESLYISSPAFYRGKRAEVSRFILAPFMPEGGDRQREISLSSKERQKGRHGKPLQTILAWVCTNTSCIAWERIQSDKELHIIDKKCPLCQADMIRGQKDIEL